MCFYISQYSACILLRNISKGDSKPALSIESTAFYRRAAALHKLINGFGICLYINVLKICNYIIIIIMNTRVTFRLTS